MTLIYMTTHFILCNSKILQIINNSARYRSRWHGPDRASAGWKMEPSFFSGRDDGIHRRGVAAYITSKAKKSVLCFEPKSERLMKIRRDTRWLKTSIVIAYAPTEDAEEEEKDIFYGDLGEMVRSIPLHDILMVIGDMNAKVGRETDIFSGAIGRESLHENCNENGFRLASFAAEHSLVIGGTLFKHRIIQLQTWISPDGNNRNQINPCISKQKAEKIVV